MLDVLARRRLQGAAIFQLTTPAGEHRPRLQLGAWDRHVDAQCDRGHGRWSFQLAAPAQGTLRAVNICFYDAHCVKCMSAW